MLFGARRCLHRLHKSRHELIDFARAGVAIIWQTKKCCSFALEESEQCFGNGVLIPAVESGKWPEGSLKMNNNDTAIISPRLFQSGNVLANYPNARGFVRE